MKILKNIGKKPTCQCLEDSYDAEERGQRSNVCMIIEDIYISHVYEYIQAICVTRHYA